MAKIALRVWRGKFNEVPLSSIDIGPARCRTTFTEIQELAESFRTYGMLHPLTVSTHPDAATPGGKQYLLVAGERRLRALILLNADPVPIIVRNDLSDLERKLLEVEENIQRVNLSWQERIEGERQADELRRQIAAAMPGAPAWRQDDTAAELGVSRQTITRDLAFAQKLADHPELRAEVAKLPMSAAIRKVARIEAAQAASRAGVVATAAWRLGDSRDLLRDVASGSVACVVTDPPFGVGDIADASGGEGSKTATYKQQLQASDNLDAERVRKLIKWFVPELARVLLDGGHFYIFYANQLYPELRAACNAAGLAVQEYPVIWYKGHGMAPGRGYMYTSCTELILYGWKPPRKRMLERTMPALIEQKTVSVGRRLHAFQKPVALLETLIRQSTIQGETVLDPFGGVASTVVAALRSHRVGIGFELCPQHHLLGGKRISDELAKTKGGVSDANE